MAYRRRTTSRRPSRSYSARTSATARRATSRRRAPSRRQPAREIRLVIETAAPGIGRELVGLKPAASPRKAKF